MNYNMTRYFGREMVGVADYGTARAAGRRDGGLYAMHVGKSDRG